jgi:hypothetical protein
VSLSPSSLLVICALQVAAFGLFNAGCVSLGEVIARGRPPGRLLQGALLDALACLALAAGLLWETVRARPDLFSTLAP